MRNATDYLPQRSHSPLAQRLGLHQQLLAAVRRVLPSYLKNHCQLCWLNRRGQLVLQVTGAEYATQIRFFLAAMQEAASKATGLNIPQLLIKTALPSHSPVRKKTVATPAAAHLIAEEACGHSVPEISAALQRLAASMASQCAGKDSA
jgi:hypothetical protein